MSLTFTACKSWRNQAQVSTLSKRCAPQSNVLAVDLTPDKAGVHLDER